VARAKNNLGTLLLRQKSRSNEGRELLRESRDQLETLTKEFPTIPQYQQDLAFVLRNLGLAAKLAGQPAEALIDLSAALRIRKKLTDDAPGFPEHRMDLAVEAGEVAYLLAASDPAAAETVAREALDRVAKLADHQPPIPSYVDSVGRAHYEMAKLLMTIKKRDDARSAIEQSIRYHRQALDLRPENFEYRANLGAAVGLSSEILLDRGETAAAANAAEELPRLIPGDVNSYSNAAKLLMKCLNAAKDQRQEYGRRAVGILQKAVDERLIKDAKQLNFKEFRELKERDDFSRLLKSLEPPRPG
jgi:tetratricopeptide (TPR) repeat protein